MLFPGKRRRRVRPKDPDPELVVSPGDDQTVDIDLTAPADDRVSTPPEPGLAAAGDGDIPVAGLTSLDSLLADPTPDPHSPTGPPRALDGRTYVRQSVGVGEVPEQRSEPVGSGHGAGSDHPPVSFTGSSSGLLLQIPVDAIQPNVFQPRRRFDEDALASLTDSVRELGVLQPILVRRVATPGQGLDSTIEFELVAGERRWRAARRAGLTKVPAIVRDVSDLRSLEEAIVENLHRSDLNPLEEAAAYQQLIDEFGLSQAQVAQRVGKSRSAVANTLRLVQLPVSVQRLVVAGDLSAGHGRAVLMVPSFDQPELATRIVSEQLSVRQAEELAQNWSERRRGGSPGKDRAGGRSSNPDGGARSGRALKRRSSGALEVEQHLANRLDTRVRVEESAKGGRIVVDFADQHDLARIFSLLGSDESDTAEFG